MDSKICWWLQQNFRTYSSLAVTISRFGSVRSVVMYFLAVGEIGRGYFTTVSIRLDFVQKLDKL